MKNFKLLIILTSIVISFSFVSNEKAFGQKIAIKLTHPTAGKLGVSDLWKATITNTTKETYRVYFYGTLKEEKAGLIAIATTVDIDIKPGTTNLKANDFPIQPDISYPNSDPKYKKSLIRTGNVPSGEYEYCIYARLKINNEELGSNCINQPIPDMGLISLISPNNEGEIDPEQPLIFTWMSTKLPRGSRFTLIIVEVREGQSPQTAFENNTPWFKKSDINATTYKYPKNAKPLEDRNYAWGVKSVKIASEIWSLSIKKQKIYDLLSASIRKINTGDSCCYNLVVTNNYTGSKIGLIPKVYRISINGASISSISGGPTTGWTRRPVMISPQTISVKWNKNQGYIPNGLTNLGNLCFGNITKDPFFLVYEWYNESGKILCKDSVKVDCKTSPSPSCCVFNMVFTNNIGNPNLYSKIRVSAQGETIIKSGDPDEWNQITYLPNFIEWSPPNGNIPNNPSQDESIDNDFMIYLEQATTNVLKVDWFDLNGLVKCTQFVKILCRQEVSSDEDWTINTSRTSIDDPNLFVFAEQEIDEGENCIDDIECETVTCPLTKNITCVSNADNNPIYKIVVTGPDNFSIYTWDVKNSDNQNVTIQNGQNTKEIEFKVTTGGLYKISFFAENSTTNECCDELMFINIPKLIQGDFSWKQDECGLKVTFNAQIESPPDCEIEYKWSCAGLNDFNSTNKNYTYTFQEGQEYNITLILKDCYGCVYKIAKTIKVITECTPDFYTEYKFCKESAGTNVNVKVDFYNTSKGGICPITFNWEFGDGGVGNSESGSVEPSISHIYNVDASTGGNFEVKLSMKDIEVCNTQPAIITKTISIKPCSYYFTITKCPDGKVVCHAFDGSQLPNIVPSYGEWQTPGSCDDQIINSLGLDLDGSITIHDKKYYKDKTIKYCSDGQYVISFIGINENGCRCKVDSVINITLACCAKNDAERLKEKFQEGNKKYKLKCKMIQRQLPLYHAIRVKTKLKIFKKNKLGIWYYSGAKADEIQSGFSGYIWRRGILNNEFCNCFAEELINDFTPILQNERKAKITHSTSGRFRSRKNSLISTHYVKIGSTVKTIHLYLGKDCDDYCRLLDWY